MYNRIELVSYRFGLRGGRRTLEPGEKAVLKKWDPGFNSPVTGAVRNALRMDAPGQATITHHEKIVRAKESDPLVGREISQYTFYGNEIPQVVRDASRWYGGHVSARLLDSATLVTPPQRGTLFEALKRAVRRA